MVMACAPKTRWKGSKAGSSHSFTTRHMSIGVPIPDQHHKGYSILICSNGRLAYDIQEWQDPVESICCIQAKVLHYTANTAYQRLPCWNATATSTHLKHGPATPTSPSHRPHQHSKHLSKHTSTKTPVCFPRAPPCDFSCPAQPSAAVGGHCPPAPHPPVSPQPDPQQGCTETPSTGPLT